MTAHELNELGELEPMTAGEFDAHQRRAAVRRIAARRERAERESEADDEAIRD